MLSELMICRVSSGILAGLACLASQLALRFILELLSRQLARLMTYKLDNTKIDSSSCSHSSLFQVDLTAMQTEGKGSVLPASTLFVYLLCSPVGFLFCGGEINYANQNQTASFSHARQQ